MNWIKVNWKIALIASIILLAVLVAGDIATRLWLGYDFPIEFSVTGTTIFNNIVTPIAAIVSAWLFVGLTRRQQRLAESQNIRTHFEREFDRIGALLREEKYSLNGKKYSAMNCWALAWELASVLTNDQDYMTDLTELRENERPLGRDIMQRSYWKFIKDIVPLIDGVSEFEAVEEFVREINQSPRLLEEDKAQYRLRIRNEFIGRYMSNFDVLTSINAFSFPNPMTFDQEGRLEWMQIGETGMGKHQRTFKDLGLA
jgi:hypothetical protein